MAYKRTILLCCLSLFIGISLRAQIEVAQLISKGYSATGYGGFLNVGGMVSKGDAITGEIGFYYFAPHSSHILVLPLLAGYRHTFNHKGFGLYVEPCAGYTFGGTDIQKTNASGVPLVDGQGNIIDQEVSGATAGMGVGYILESTKFPLNFGLRYRHVFVSADPAQDLISFRISYCLFFRKRG